MDSVYASETYWPDLHIDDVTPLTADDLDVELLREFFGSSLGEEISKSGREDNSSPKPSTSTPSLPSMASPPSPPEPSKSASMPPMASTAPSSSTSVPSTSSPSPAPPTSSTAASSSRKRKLVQERSCVNCQTRESSMWRRDPEGNTLCNACGQHFYKFKVHRPAEMFNRPIKKRCRKEKQEESKAASSALLPPMNYFNFQLAPQYRLQQQPHQINDVNYSMASQQHFQHQQQQIPPPYAYYQPAPQSYPQFPCYQPPPPEAYYPYGHPAYPMMPFSQQSQW